MPGTGRDGDCFMVAARVAETRVSGDVRLVHGTPIGTGPYNGGQRYWHAWVEVDHPIDLAPLGRPGEVLHSVTVYDYANGNHMELPKEIYYGFGKLTEDHVWRYTLDEAHALMAETGNYGPWETVEGVL